MPDFPSYEWMKELVEMLNGSEEYQKAAAAYEGVMALLIKAEEGKLEKDILGYVHPYHGQITEYGLWDDLEGKNPMFIISAPYSTWKKVVKGEIDPMGAIMKGKIRIKGDMAKLLKRTHGSQLMMEAMKQIETQFIDEA